MSKFSEILVLVSRKIFSAFSIETFSKLLPPYLRVSLFSHHLVFYDRKHFFFSIMTVRATFHTGSDHQKFHLLGYNLKNLLTKHFPKMKKQPFADVLRNRCSKFTSLKTCNFIKKETPIYVFLCEYRSSRPKVFLNKVFLEISQNSQENTCARVSFLIKLQALSLQHY